MRLIQYLKEDYIGMVKGVRGVLTPQFGFLMFSNPTPKELTEFSKQIHDNGFSMVRFIIDDRNKHVYVSSGGLYHPIFFGWLKKESLVSNMKDCLAGAGEVAGGKIDIEGLSVELPAPKKIERFVWASKYFTNLEKYIKE
jgi:hypothetical protein